MATGRFGVVSGGRREAVWRVRHDGVVELVRAFAGRVELFEIPRDGSSSQLVTASSPSGRKRLAGTLEAVGFACFLATFPLGFLVSTKFFAGGLVWAALALVAAAVKGTSHVRPWVMGRFGTDEGWAPVPWRITGTPTTGNQVVALAALADGRNDTYYRVLDSGDIEVVSGRSSDIRHLDAAGEVVQAWERPKGVKVRHLVGSGDAWYRVYSRDPDE